MSAMSYNGAAIIAMTGKQCVAIASDRRLGVQACTVASDFDKVFRLHDKLYVGLAGLATDVISLHEHLRFRLNLYKLAEERDIKPSTFGHMLSSVLYEKRFGPWFTEPIVAGLEGEDHTPYITAMDFIGAAVDTKDFVVAGTCSENMYGMCESLYRPEMEPDELFETISQCLLSAVDRDALSGWGAIVHVITPEGVTTRELRARID